MLQMYSIYDKKVGTYGAPTFSKNVVEIQRSIINVLREGKSLLSQFPADYALYLVGTFDQDLGAIIHPFTPGPQFTLEIASLLEAPNG